MEKIAIIIVNYNGLPYIKDCLLSLYKVNFNTYKVKIFVVDNNSSDASLKFIKENFKDITIIENKKNLGFAQAVNKGILQAIKESYNYFLLLNPDTIVNKNFFVPLMDLINSCLQIGIVSPILISKKGKEIVYNRGAKLNFLLGRVKHIELKNKPKTPIKELLVSACCFLVKKEVIDKIGYFDNRFFMYFEDVDFCLRVSRAGFEIYTQPKSIIWHQVSASLKGLSFKKAKYLWWSNLIFILKWIKPWFWPLSFLYLIWLKERFICSLIKKKLPKREH